jgi:hypothetical protein
MWFGFLLALEEGEHDILRRQSCEIVIVVVSEKTRSAFFLVGKGGGGRAGNLLHHARNSVSPQGQPIDASGNELSTGICQAFPVGHRVTHAFVMTL